VVASSAASAGTAASATALANTNLNMKNTPLTTRLPGNRRRELGVRFYDYNGDTRENIVTEYIFIIWRKLCH
jgi:hypothetical protein